MNEPTKERDETVSLLRMLRNRAVQQRSRFTTVASMARGIYGGDPSIAMSTFAPNGERNFWHSQTRVGRNKLCEGDVQGVVTSKSGKFAALAEFMQQHLSSIISSKSFAPKFLMAGHDNYMHSGAYLYVHSSSDYENLSWFQVYPDAAKATSAGLETGRYCFIYRLVDRNEMWQKWQNELSVAGFASAESLPSASAPDDGALQPVGTYFNYMLQERETKTSPKSVPGVGLAGSTPDYDDGMVLEWECLLHDGKSPSGWSLYYMLGGPDVLLGEGEDVPEILGGLPIAYWPGDFLSGQFYQPSAFIYVYRSQAAYNWIRMKQNMILAQFEFPGTKSTEENKRAVAKWRNKPGENLVLKDFNGFGTIELPQPPPGYDAVMEGIRNDVEEESGINPAIQGIEPKEATSGIAIAEQYSHASIQLEDRFVSRDEFLRDFFRLIITYLYMEVIENAMLQYREILEEFAEDPVANSQWQSLVDTPADKAWIEFLPEPFKDVELKEFTSDMVLNFHVMPKLPRERKMAIMLQSIPVATSLAGGDPVLAVRLAGVITGYVAEAKELEDAVTSYNSEQQRIENQTGRQISNDYKELEELEELEEPVIEPYGTIR